MLVDGEAKALAAEEEPEDAEFPVLEPGETGVGAIIEIDERAGGNEVFAAAFTGGKEEGDIGDLLGDGIHGAVNPDDLLVGVGEESAGAGNGVAGEEGVDVGRKRFLHGGRG